MSPTPPPATLRPIGVFDSGLGGLSVLREIHKLLPYEDTIYLADQANVPYGPRPLSEVREYAEAITTFFLKQNVKLIVVACNTASAAALHYLREKFPSVPFVGMEPAIKPAVENTSSGVVGVLATPATFQGALYASVVERFAQGVTVLQHTCPGLVNQIEAGEFDTPKTRHILEDALKPMLAKNIDTVVLGCTHYPFVIPLIQEIVGDQVRVIDPAPAVARQVMRVLESFQALNPTQIPSHRKYLTSGNLESYQQMLIQLGAQPGEVLQVVWRDRILTAV